MDSPMKGYSRSEWSSLSIQERIRAMNDTLDTVEQASALALPAAGNNNLGLLDMPLASDEESTSFLGSPVHSMISEEDLADAEAAVAAIPKRSSVVDIWRKRESPSKQQPLRLESTTETVETQQSQALPLQPVQPVQSVTTTPMKAVKMSTHKKEQEEKKQDQDEQPPPPSALRNLWSQRSANSPAPSAPSRNNGVMLPSKKAVAAKPPPVHSNEPTDLTIMPADEPSPEDELAPSKRTNIWAQRGLYNSSALGATESPQVLPATTTLEAEAPVEKTTPVKRSSVVEIWKHRKSPAHAAANAEDASTAAETVETASVSASAPGPGPEPASPTLAPVPKSRNTRGVDRWNKGSVNVNAPTGSDQPLVELSISAVDSKLSEASPQQSPQRAKVLDMWSQRMAPVTVVQSAAEPVVPSAPTTRYASPKRNKVTERWGKRISDHQQEQDDSRVETSTEADEKPPVPATNSFKPAPAKVTSKWAKPSEYLESPSVADSSVDSSQDAGRRPETASNIRLDTASSASKVNKIAALSPARGKVAERWMKNLPDSPSRAFSSAGSDTGSVQLQADTDEPIAPPPFSVQLRKTGLPKRGNVADRWRNRSNDSQSVGDTNETEPVYWKQGKSSAAATTVPESPSATLASEKSAATDELRASAVVQSWNQPGHSFAPRPQLPKPTQPPKRFGVARFSPKVGDKLESAAESQAAVTKPATLDPWSNDGRPADVDSDSTSSTASKNDPARLMKKNNLMRMAHKHVTQGLAHKLADNGSIAKHDDSSQVGDVLTTANSIATRSTATTVAANSKRITPPDPEPGGKTLAVETAIAAVTSEEADDDDYDEDDLTPRSKKYVERLIEKKKKLQAKRRKLKISRSSDSGGDRSLQSDSMNSFDSGMTPLSAGLPPAVPKQAIKPNARQAGPERADDLGPIDENSAANGPHENAFPSTYTPLGVSDSESPWLPADPNFTNVTSPRSEAGQSESGFSFTSGISRTSSGISTSSLASRAEKVLQERRRKSREAGMSKDEQLQAKNLARKVLNPQDPHGPRVPPSDNYKYPALLQGTDDHFLAENTAAARARAKRAGLSTRYNTSSRFIDTDPSYGAAAMPGQGHADGILDHHSFSSADSGDSSEFRSLGSTTTASENDARSSRRHAKKKARALSRGKSKPDAALPPTGIVSEQFFSESSSNVEAFKSAYESVSIAQIATDVAEEVSYSVNSTVDFKKFATDMNDSIRKYCGIKTTESLPKCDDLSRFGDEDADEDAAVAGDTMDTDDLKADLGGCSVLDGEIAVASPQEETGGLWDKPGNTAPAGQPSFEDSSSRQGVRAAYV